MALLIALLACGCEARTDSGRVDAPPLELPAADSVVAVAYQRGGSPIVLEVPLPLVGSRSEDRPAIERLLGWLRAAGPPGSVFAQPREYMPLNVANFKLGVGEHLNVFAAMDCVTRKIDGGEAFTCSQAPGYVDVLPPGSSVMYRLRSPELYAWLADDGWRADLRLGTQAEFNELWH